ncbi:hypothetical protein M9H77_11234 [Catharanthus roseus]|uniref:Uncharacterized protein n=1 Tax=Catharanthus roseus TaxID=4058 RepID=A0ACC0BE19_CATRO|nr:hypothetical protein M9H77_11234 [Catharanthus roseus]
MASGIVVIFDFDKTIIDLDSDNWVVDELGFNDLFNQLVHSIPWNSMMDKLMEEIHANGKTKEDIERVLKRVPIHPRIVPAIKTAHALGCDLRIVSDANEFFIETILKNLGIKECFSEINTNPGYIDENGRLRIFPYHDFHVCNNLCPPNMCKGKIVERIQNSSKKRVIYIGDGIGDFCPSLKLKEGDYVMPRKNFPVWDLINKNRTLVKAEIHEWTDGDEFERILIQLINKILFNAEENIIQLLSNENWNLQKIPVSVPQAFLQALQVPH